MAWSLAAITYRNLSRTPAAFKSSAGLSVSEYDAWSFVRGRTRVRWLRAVLCRRTRQVVARQLRERIPEDERQAFRFSDCLGCGRMIPSEQYVPASKESEETNDMER